MSLFRLASEGLRSETEEDFRRLDRLGWLVNVTQYGFTLRDAPAALRTDREIVLAAVTRNGKALEYASVALRADKEVVLAAVAKHGYALYHASAALRADKEVVLAAVAKYALALKYASEELKTDREVVLAAVVTRGLALQYASPALQSDKEVVLVAVAQHGYALEYASGALHACPALLAVTRTNLSLLAAELRLRCGFAMLPGGVRNAHGGASLALLSADIVGVIGAYVSRAAVVIGLAARHNYYASGEREELPPARKRRRYALV